MPSVREWLTMSLRATRSIVRSAGLTERRRVLRSPQKNGDERALRPPDRAPSPCKRIDGPTGPSHDLSMQREGRGRGSFFWRFLQSFLQSFLHSPRLPRPRTALTTRPSSSAAGRGELQRGSRQPVHGLAQAARSMASWSKPCVEAGLPQTSPTRLISQCRSTPE
jgi:hypothetical protein